MTKAEVLAAALRGEGCLGQCADDEPVFVLTARDMLASGLVRKWADDLESIADRAGELTPRRALKVRSARDEAIEMDAWRHKNGGHLPGSANTDPDRATTTTAVAH